MRLSINNHFSNLKKIIIKNELIFLYFFLALASFNNLSHFIKKNILGDRIDFWDFHVYWCSANKFINGVNPYGGNIIKNCLYQFNFDLYFSYPPIILKSLSFLGYYDLNTAKIIWISIIVLSFLTIIFYIKKIYKSPKIIFFTFFIIFAGGGIIWSALFSGNISTILYAILTIGIYYLINEKQNIFYLCVSIISLAKFPFLIFFLLPIFLNGFKEIKKVVFYFSITFFIYILQFYLINDLFISFLNSTKSYRGENFLDIHGTGIGIHGIVDQFLSLIYKKTEIQILNPSSTSAFFLHIFISFTLFFSSFILFRKKRINLKQKKLLISFFIIIFLSCFPRISSYDFFLLISSFFYITFNSRVKFINNNWKFIFSILPILFLAIYDSKFPAFILSLIIFIIFYLQIKGNDPFYLNKNIQNV